MGYETFGLASGLEEFVAVARHGHITRAAEELEIPQPTLSRAMARLSAHLGVPLVQRDGRGIQLTHFGQQLAEHAEGALADLVAGLRAVRAEADPDTGTVVLGFLDSMGPSVVPDLLQSFRRERPGVVIRLVQDGTDELVGQVLAGRIDLCLAHLTKARIPELGSRVLAEQPLVLLVPVGHSLAGRGPVKLRDLVGESLITFKPGYGLRTLSDRLLRTARVPLTYTLESQDIATASGLVAAGLGLALLPAGNRVSGTVELPIADSGATRRISLMWRRDRPATPPIVDLRCHIEAAGPRLLAVPSASPLEATEALAE